MNNKVDDELFAKVLLLGFDPNKLSWHEGLVFVWVLMFLIDEIQKVCNEKLKVKVLCNAFEYLLPRELSKPLFFQLFIF